ncbi:MAG: 30S ribosomal protein S17e [Nanoarchaeota archaeon]|nr:30S ribosomal protein S17e [Nanoarchaeota archaeon]
MGRIKTQFIKRTSKKLMAMHSEKFSESYEKNKVVLGGLIVTGSPKIRNVIAGYITRLKRMGG